jgi:hypothetical protein
MNKNIKKKIILINGQKRAGKDTTAEFLKQDLLNKGKSVEIFAFADKLKDMVCEMFNLTKSQLDYYKNQEFNIFAEIVEERVNFINEQKLTDFRTFLDIFGNKIAKTLGGNNVWADIVLKQVQESDSEYFILSDFRFPIEFEVFMNKGFKFSTIKVQRDLPKSNLESENALKDFYFDIILDNNSDLESLRVKVSRISETILEES